MKQHTVKPGENLSLIARRYAVSVAAIVAANQIADANLIKVGQVLTIPEKVPTPAPDTAKVSRLLTQEFFRKTFPALKPTTISEMLPGLIATVARFNINTPARFVCFLAQCAHESAGLTQTSERGSKAYFKQYAPGTRIGKRLGNKLPNSGERFKGLGYIQLTGEYNFRLASAALSIDLINDTERLRKDLTICWLVSGYFWDRESLNLLADQVIVDGQIVKLDSFDKITMRINGGLKGKEERIAWLQKINQAVNEVIQ